MMKLGWGGEFMVFHFLIFNFFLKKGKPPYTLPQSGSGIRVICEWVDPCTKSDRLAIGLTSWPITYFARGV